MCFKFSRCVGTPGQKLPQPSEVPPPTLPHMQKQTRVPLAAWIRVWDLSRSTAPSPYDPYGPIRKWASKKKQKQRKHLKQNLLTSNRVPFNHKFGCCCMLLPRGISEAWFLAVNTSSCSYLAQYLTGATHHLKGQGSANCLKHLEAVKAAWNSKCHGEINSPQGHTRLHKAT